MNYPQAIVFVAVLMFVGFLSWTWGPWALLFLVLLIAAI